jgi:hemerythrin-like domain-containing protein
MNTDTTTSPPATATTADLDSYLRVHRALRTSAARFASAVERDDPSGRAPLRRWYAGFADEIRCHHHIEDVLLFPALAERVATYDQYRERLESDHAELDELLPGLTAELDEGGSHVRAVRLSRKLSDHLHEHLDHEDDEIVPLFARHFTSEEFEVLNQRAIKMTPPRQLLFTAPWMMAEISAAERVDVLRSAPKAVHLLWFATRRRYARLARRAMGGAA